MYQGVEWPTAAKNLVRHGWFCSKGLGDFGTGSACPDDPIIYYTQPPMNRNIIALSLAIFGYHEWAGRLPVILMSTGVILLIYMLGFQIRSRLLGFLAAMLALLTPAFQFFGRHTEHDQPALFFALIACVLYLAWSSNRSTIFFRLMIAASWLAQFSAWAGHLLMPCLILHYFFFVRKKDEDYRDTLWLVFAWVMGCAIVILYLVWAAGITPRVLYDRFVYRSKGTTGESFVFWEYYQRLYKLTGDYYTPILRLLAVGGMIAVIWNMLRKKCTGMESFLPFLVLWGWSHPFLLRQDMMWHDFRIYYLLPGCGLLIAFLIVWISSRFGGIWKSLVYALLGILIVSITIQQSIPRADKAFKFRGRFTGRNLEGLRTAGQLVRENRQWAALLAKNTPILSSVDPPTGYMGFVWYGDVPWIRVCTIQEFEQARSTNTIIPLFLGDQQCTPDLWAHMLANYETRIVDSYLIAFLDRPSIAQNRPLPEKYLANLGDCLYLYSAYIEHAQIRQLSGLNRLRSWFCSAVDAERPDELSRTFTATLHWYVAKLPDMDASASSAIYFYANRYGLPHTFVLDPDWLSKRIPLTLWKAGGYYSVSFTFTLPEEVEPGRFQLKAAFYDPTSFRYLKEKKPSGEETESIPIGTVQLADVQGRVPDITKAALPGSAGKMQKKYEKDPWVFKIGYPDNSMDEIETARRRYNINRGNGSMIVNINTPLPLEALITPYWRGAGSGGSDKPLEIQYNLDKQQDLILYLGTTALTHYPRERFVVKVDSDQWPYYFRDRSLGTFIKAGGSYKIFRIPIPRAWTVQGKNTVKIYIPDFKPRIEDLSGWRQAVQRVFPDWDLLLGENPEPYDGMITFDFIALEKS